MKITVKLIALAIGISALGCKQNNEGKLEVSDMSLDTAGIKFEEYGIRDDDRKFIRTANIKFRVKDVINSSQNIERITRNHHGFVTSSNLTSTQNNIYTTAISADSSLETTSYTTSNSITLRVPNESLDTTLSQISMLVDHLEYQVVKADDVRLQLLENRLNEKRLRSSRLQNAIDKKGSKLIDITSAEAKVSENQQHADDKKIENLSLNDQVNFSTVNLTIYQRELIKREVLANNKNVDEYQPGFGSKMLESLAEGWRMLESFVIFVSRFWIFILVAFVLFWFINKPSLLVRRK